MKYQNNVADQIVAGNRIYKFNTVANDAGTETVFVVEFQALRNGQPYGPIGNSVKLGKRHTIREDSGQRTYKTPLERDADGKLITEPFIREATGYLTLADAIAAVHKHAEKPYIAKGRYAEKMRNIGKEIA